MVSIMLNMDIRSLTKEQVNIRRRIVEISYQAKLSHLGSCLSAVDLIDCVYKFKKKEEKLVLSCGHTAVALYAVLEKYGFIKDLNILKNLHVHPDRNPDIDIHVSTGSLGQGLPIALGMALANRKNGVYCMISDGECAEGSIWEALRVASDNKVTNLKIVLNANGWGAYGPVALEPLIERIKAFGYRVVEVDGHKHNSISKALKLIPDHQPILIFARTDVEQFPFLRGLDAHYYVMSEDVYTLLMYFLK